MVGHTGDRHAANVAMEVVDRCLGRQLDAVRELDGVARITADHGNADEMYMRDKKTGEFTRDADGQIVPKTSHTLNPVPLVLFDPRDGGGLALDRELAEPGLANVAATILALLGLEAPDGYRPSLLAAR
ncbi:MAG: 2,3-bisphosphoglycerate-independent phosphoglycerate mutase, partial [Myxococcota bacterium]|nr:2,3-bisphosphoglycerate-independent phosphoglycerate mutase [Myxococcota bacterium]